MNIKKALKNKITPIAIGITIGVGSLLNTSAIKAEEHIFIPIYNNTGNTWTGIGLTNPSKTKTVKFNTIVRDEKGNILSEMDKELGPNNQTAYVPGEDLEDLEGKLASIEIVGDGHLNSVALEGNDNTMKQISANYSNIKAWQIPHLATKDGWKSKLNIQNNTNESNSGIVEFYTQNGELNGTYEMEIPAKGVKQIDIGKEFGEKDGNLKLKFNSGITPGFTYKYSNGKWETSILPLKLGVRFGNGYVKAADGLNYLTDNGDDKIYNEENLKIIDLESRKEISNDEFNYGDLEGEIKKFIANGNVTTIMEDTPAEISNLNSSYNFEIGMTPRMNFKVEENDPYQFTKKCQVYDKNNNLLKEIPIDEDGRLTLTLPRVNIVGTQRYKVVIESTNEVGDKFGQVEKEVVIKGYAHDEHHDADYGHYN